MRSRRATPKRTSEWVVETQLIDRINAGEEPAFRQLMQRYNQSLYRVARAIVSDDAEAEDVLQESYTRAFAAMPGFRGDSSLGTWLTRIVINESRGRLRRRRTVAQAADALKQQSATVIGFPAGQPVESPDTLVARAETRRLLEQAIDSLPDVFRPTFILRDIQEFTVEETAEILGVQPETVKTRLYRARRLLRKSLDATLADAVRGSFPFLGKRCERLTEAVLTRLMHAGK